MTGAVVVSHGADFFGEDRHSRKVLGSLARYAEGILPAAERDQLVQLLLAAETGTDLDVPAAAAGAFAQQLRQIARHRFVKSKAVALAAALLADAAARAAADGEPWNWHTDTTA